LTLGCGGDLVTAIFGLAGVVIGGLLTFGSQLYIARKEEQAELRTAARVVAQELGRVEHLIKLWLSLRRIEGAWWEPAEEWLAHRSSLAAGLDAVAWEAVSWVYNRLEDYELGIKDGASQTDELRELRSSLNPDVGAGEALALMEETLTRTRVAIRALVAVAGDRDPSMI
jgi:hypothetical protein